MVFYGGVVAAIKNKQQLKIFKKANAVGRENGKTLEELGLKQGNIVVKRLVLLKAVAVDQDKYYVTEEYSRTKRFARV